jgi:S-adenosylmethionine:tRNA ribosyltransferase-isomerase
MRVDAFDFDLPPDRIALRPVSPRDSARLLVVDSGGMLSHRHVRDLPDLLRSGDRLVINDTRVISARLRGHRVGRGTSSPKIEVLLHKRASPNVFLAFARPARKLAEGDELRLGSTLAAHVRRRLDAGELELRFTVSGAELDAQIAVQGEVPLPPYIAGKRAADDRDRVDYQTVFARHDGSVAAPTAGLHFTAELFERLSHRGIGQEAVTLHVGAGTFLPVSSSDTSGHKMHAEWASVSDQVANSLNAARQAGGRIVAVGTTSLRTLESAARGEPRILPYAGETDIFITPGYKFSAVDILLTNFHLPRSTLYMLVCAFCGMDVIGAAYAEAIRQNYRFYSYGDACLLFRPIP